MLLAWSAWGGECIQVRELRTGTVEVVAFDIRGERLDNVEAELLDARTLKKVDSSGDGHFQRVVYGEYRVRAWVRGFYPVEVPRRLEQPTLAVRTQLTVGEVCREFSSLIGTVVSTKHEGSG